MKLREIIELVPLPLFLMGHLKHKGFLMNTVLAVAVTDFPTHSAVLSSCLFLINSHSDAEQRLALEDGESRFRPGKPINLHVHRKAHMEPAFDF